MDKEWLYQQYVVQERSVTEIAEDLKIPREILIKRVANILGASHPAGTEWH